MNKELQISNLKETYKSKCKLVVIINIIAIIVVSFLSYYKFKIKDYEKVFLFIGSDYKITATMNDDLNDIVCQYDFKKFAFNNYLSGDTYFPNAMATKGYYDSDLIILKERDLASYSSLGIYEKIDESKVNNTSLIYDEKAIKLDAINYVIINSRLDKNRDMLYQIINYLSSIGGEANG